MKPGSLDADASLHRRDAYKNTLDPEHITSTQRLKDLQYIASLQHNRPPLQYSAEGFLVRQRLCFLLKQKKGKETRKEKHKHDICQQILKGFHTVNINLSKTSTRHIPAIYDPFCGWYLQNVNSLKAKCHTEVREKAQRGGIMGTELVLDRLWDWIHQHPSRFANNCSQFVKPALRNMLRVAKGRWKQKHKEREMQ